MKNLKIARKFNSNLKWKLPTPMKSPLAKMLTFYLKIHFLGSCKIHTSLSHACTGYTLTHYHIFWLLWVEGKVRQKDRKQREQLKSCARKEVAFTCRYLFSQYLYIKLKILKDCWKKLQNKKGWLGWLYKTTNTFSYHSISTPLAAESK